MGKGQSSRQDYRGPYSGEVSPGPETHAPQAFAKGQAWAAPYTDNKPGLSPYRGVDQNGNPIGAIARGRRGPDNEPMTAPLAPVVQGSCGGFSGKLPRK